MDRFVRRPALTWEEGTEPLRLVWCGEFSPRKNPAAVVELATILHRRGIDVTLDMLGEGPLFDSEEARSPVPGLVNRHGKQDVVRSEEHTSELQSRGHLVCRLLLEKKNNTIL